MFLTECVKKHYSSDTQKSKTVCKINCKDVLPDVRQLLPENGKRGKKYINGESSMINVLRTPLCLKRGTLNYLASTQIILQDYSTRRINPKFYFR